MGMSLEEYARLHPQQQPEREREQMAAQAADMEDQQHRQVTAERLKDVIQQQMEQGQAPQTVLYTALQCIGTIFDDAAWTEANTARLDAVYKDLAQQSMIIDEREAAAKQLEEMQADYNKKLRRKVSGSLASYRRIETALQNIQNELDFLDPQAETTT